MRQVLIIGLGSFGTNLADELATTSCEIVIIETDPEKAKEFSQKVTQVVVGDATDKELLKRFAQDIDIAVNCIGEKVDSSILVTHFLKELGVKRIIAKASSHDHGRVLKVVGAHEVIFPERDEAKRLSNNIISPDVLEFIRLSDEYNIVEVAIPTQFANKTIKELNLRKKYAIEILAIKNPLQGNVIVMPDADYTFVADDIMVVMGASESLKKLPLE